MQANCRLVLPSYLSHPRAGLHVSKLSSQYNVIALPLVLTMLMTIVVSGITTVMALGFQSGWYVVWCKAWLASWAIAFPTMVLVLPFARRLVARFVEAPPT